MTTRNDIIDGTQSATRKYGLIYTKKCGWLDLGHANPEGANKLWNDINSEKSQTRIGARDGFFDISYSQGMGNKYIKAVTRKKYAIKKGLSLKDKKSVALAIFLDVSKTFEAMQGNWLFKHFTNSSFSAEDLVSNLIGFYRAVEPNVNYIRLCEPVTKDIALGIWDKFGAVGANKNIRTIPFIYPLPDQPNAGPMSAMLPSYLNTIIPAKQGILFNEGK